MENPHDRLWRLVAARDAEGADVEAIDAVIRADFATTCAVVFTDLVGFSRHTERFGILAFLTLIHRKRALLAGLIETAGGSILKHEADSWLIVFPQPAAALDAMVACLERLAAYNVGRPGEQRLDLCVGIGYGEVLLVGDGDVWGREVNTASRLGEDTARGGEILVSEAFRDAVAGQRPQTQFEALAIESFPGPCWRLVGWPSPE
jgi:class 3 adenylate cyclase